MLLYFVEITLGREKNLVHTFEFDGKYFALDVESGSVHMLDEYAYEIIGRLAQEDDINKALESGFPLLEEIKQLKEQGLLFSEPEEAEEKGKSVIKAMCLHLAHDCNLGVITALQRAAHSTASGSL